MQQEIARESPSGNAGLEISSVPFSAFPGQSRLFLDFLSDPKSLRRFYPNTVVSAAGLAEFAGQALADYPTDRSLLCDALVGINENLGQDPTVFANIDKLRESDTVAVVTGQQAGLFSGPLYTLYKALSAVKASEILDEQGIKSVPVFWVATEDHDFAEVSEAFFPGVGGELFRSAYRPGGYVDDTPVGGIELDASIGIVIDDLFAHLPQTEFSRELSALLRSAWSEGVRFGEAFAKTLATLLSGKGLIFIDPRDAGIKDLSSSLYVKAIRSADEISSSITARNQQLAAEGYHTQVLAGDDYFPLFWHDDDGKRTALRKVTGEKYRAKGSRQEFELSELVDIAISEPQRFSPGVMLRPVVQDHLLPTVCYFGGAAEIAYFAQNSEVYRVLDRPITPILSRQSFSVIETKYRKTMEKFGLTLPELYDGSENILLRLAASELSVESAKLFADVEETINGELHKLDQRLADVDPTLAANLAKRRRKIIYHISALRKKTLLAEIRRHDTINRQIENLVAAVLPNGALQERSINVFAFLNRFGPGFIDWIYQSIDLSDKDHRVIHL